MVYDQVARFSKSVVMKNNELENLMTKMRYVLRPLSAQYNPRKKDKDDIRRHAQWIQRNHSTEKLMKHRRVRAKNNSGMLNDSQQDIAN